MPKPQPIEVANLPGALLKVATVSAITGLSPNSVFRKVSQGTFVQPIRLGKRCTRWKAGDVLAWLNALQASK
jgi:prophage regulatory protein